jgi:hypothetical protein
MWHSQSKKIVRGLEFVFEMKMKCHWSTKGVVRTNLQVDVGEAMSLLVAIKWLKEMEFKQVDRVLFRFEGNS